MINIDTFLKSNNKVPKWLAQHPVLKKIKTTSKIFPLIGLSNFSQEVDLNNTDEISKIIYGLTGEIDNQCYRMRDCSAYGSPAYNQIHAIVTLGIQDQCARPELKTQYLTKGGLYLARDIVYEDIVFAKAGESLFKVYNKCCTLVQKLCTKFRAVPLEKMNNFKLYSSLNLKKKFRVVFSSDGQDGAWDIITMSERGISSCQRWNGEYKRCLVGSLLDPYTGIMYLTTGGKVPLGTSMVRRCIVRFCIDSNTQKPCLVLEYMYPGESSTVRNLFKKLLSEKVGLGYSVIDNAQVNNNHYVPFGKVTALLSTHLKSVKIRSASKVNENGQHNLNRIFPYRDKFIGYDLDNTRKELTNKVIPVHPKLQRSIRVIKPIVVAKVKKK